MKTGRPSRARAGAAAFVACLVAPALRAQSRPVVLAILPFADRGSFGQDREVFEALQLGIPATIAAELRTHSELRLADPARVSQALRAQTRNPAARPDAGTAAQIGKEVGARYAVTGSFADFYGRFRLDARIVDVETGQIRKVVSNSDPALQDRAELYRIVQRVGHRILAEANPAAGSAVRESEGKPIPTEALIEFSLGLLAESKGDSAKAARHYSEALSGFPNYSEAREGLRRTRGP